MGLQSRRPGGRKYSSTRESALGAMGTGRSKWVRLFFIHAVSATLAEVRLFFIRAVFADASGGVAMSEKQEEESGLGQLARGRWTAIVGVLDYAQDIRRIRVRIRVLRGMASKRKELIDG